MLKNGSPVDPVCRFFILIYSILSEPLLNFLRLHAPHMAFAYRNVIFAVVFFIIFMILTVIPGIYPGIMDVDVIPVLFRFHQRNRHARAVSRNP